MSVVTQEWKEEVRKHWRASDGGLTAAAVDFLGFLAWVEKASAQDLEAVLDEDLEGYEVAAIVGRLNELRNS